MKQGFKDLFSDLSYNCKASHCQGVECVTDVPCGGLGGIVNDVRQVDRKISRRGVDA